MPKLIGQIKSSPESLSVDTVFILLFWGML